MPISVGEGRYRNALTREGNARGNVAFVQVNGVPQVVGRTRLSEADSGGP